MAIDSAGGGEGILNSDQHPFRSVKLHMRLESVHPSRDSNGAVAHRKRPRQGVPPYVVPPLASECSSERKKSCSAP